MLALTLAAAESSLPAPSNLKVEDIPPIPVSLVETLDRYNEGRSAALLDWHPVKREMLISTRFGDVPQIHRVAMPGGARTQLTFYADRAGAAKYRPGAGDTFVFSKDTGGAEFYQIYRFDFKTGDVTLLTDGASRNMGGHWSPDGRWLVYTSTRRNGRDTDLYVVDPSDPKTTRRLLEVEGGGWFPVDWSPDGRKLLVQERRSATDSSLYLVDFAGGTKQLLTPRPQGAQEVSYGAAAFSKDGKGLYLTTDLGSEFERLAFMDLSSRNLSFVRPDLKWDVTDIEISKDGRRLAYLTNQEGASVLQVLDTQSKRDLSVPRLPYGVISGLKWHDNGHDLGFSMSSARSPSDVYSVNVDTGALDRWTFSETGGVNPESFSQPDLIRWKSFDGRMISGFLYLPPRRFTGPRPVIINIHGGPEGQTRPVFLGRVNYFLNELGVAVIYPNVRGSSGYGKTFSMLDNGLKREDSVKDIGALLDWIATQSTLDSKRVMVTGGSYGGYMTLASAFHFNDRLCCAVDVVGISNFISFFERTQAYRRDLRRVEYGDERQPQMREFFTRIAPLNNASKISKPLFIIAGKNDPRVPVYEGEQMAAAVRKNGAPVWYLMAADEGHGFSKKKNQDFQFAATALFVKQFLIP